MPARSAKSNLMHHTCSEDMKPMRLAPGRRPFPTQIAPGSTRPKKALNITRSSSTRGKNPHAPFVARWFQKRPCLTTRSSTPLKELSKGPKTLLQGPKEKESFCFLFTIAGQEEDYCKEEEWHFKVYPCKNSKISKREKNISSIQQGSELFVFFQECLQKLSSLP